MSTSRIGIIGNGNVGGALGRGLKGSGREVRHATKDKDQLRDLVGWADIVVLAVPYAAIDDVIAAVGDKLEGKALVDVTNAIDASYNLAVGFTTSGAEELQKKLPGARVVKAFNTVFAKHMDSGRVGDRRLTVFASSDDAGAKSDVLDLARAIGFDAVDAGPLKNARLLESLGYLDIQLGFTLGMGPDIGFNLVHA